MKQERIKELLAGTPYDPEIHTVYWNHQAESWSSFSDKVRNLVAEGEAQKDAKLNAARVQLLAKAINEALDIKDAGGTPLRNSTNKLAIVLNAALKEAGLEG